MATLGSVRSKTSLEMPSGRFVELTDPHPADIDLHDIAHNLANECRYNGSCSVHYSVADHARLVVRRLRSQDAHPVTVLLGLHHDDSEAYLKDIPRPVKRILGPQGYTELEGRLQMTIHHALELDIELPDGARMSGARIEVKEADDWALGIEALALMPSKGVGWAPAVPESELDAHAIIERARSGDGGGAPDIPHDGREAFLAEHLRCLEVARHACALEGRR